MKQRITKPSLDVGLATACVLLASVAAWVFMHADKDAVAQTASASREGGHEAHGEQAEHDEHNRHEEHGGHEESEERSDLSMSLEEILGATCEHGVRTYQCAACRYEVGVVKVDPSVIRGSDAQANGLIQLIDVKKESVEHVIVVTGEIRLNENRAAHISPRIGGVIRSVNVDIGDQVKQHDVVFDLQSAELGQALNEYAKNLAMTDLARKNLEREKALYAKKISSEHDLIEAQMAFEELQTGLTAAEHKLRVLGFDQQEIGGSTLNGRNAGASSLSVRTPIDGMIIEKHAVAGELVEMGWDVMLVADLGTLWVWADIYEPDLKPLLDRMRVGNTPVEVSVLAFPNKTFYGEIDYVGATMDKQTRTVKVRAIVNNGDLLLRPGMFCEVKIALSSDEEVLAIPSQAVLSDEGVDFIFKRLNDDCFVRRKVKKGRVFQQTTEILDGVELGEMVVSHGAFLLKSDVLRDKLGAGCAD